MIEVMVAGVEGQIVLEGQGRYPSHERQIDAFRFLHPLQDLAVSPAEVHPARRASDSPAVGDAHATRAMSQAEGLIPS